MDALTAIGLCALLATPSQAAQPCGRVVEISSATIDRWQSLIEAASARFGIPADWIRAVMARESAGLTALHGAPIVSSAGAMGLMQLMPGTWSDMRARYRFGNDPFDPHDNIFAGTAYLREMFERYGFPNLFAAYHAGPGRMDAVLAGRNVLPEATKSYLESMVPGFQTESISSGKRASTTPKPRPESLFFVRENDEQSPSTATEGKREAHGLFVPLASELDSDTR